MGDTHYWRTRLGSADLENWNLACAEVRRLIAAAKVPVAYESDCPADPPEIDGERIRFNGVRKDGHETFEVLRDPTGGRSLWQKPEDRRYFDFCKTARKPYDLLVTASLLVLKAHLGDWLLLSSDGGWENWEAGAQLCTAVLGYAPEDFVAARRDIEGPEEEDDAPR